MKAHILFFAFVLLNSWQVFSQDLIVTGEGDSINCVVTKEKKDYIYFTYKEGANFKNTLIPFSEVESYQPGYFNTAEVPEYQVPGFVDYPRYRFAISGGYSYQRGEIDESMQDFLIDYSKKLKSGFHIGADITYYFNRTFGVGAKYSYFNASNQLNDIYIDYENGNREYGIMSDNINIQFFGPAFSMRFLHRYNRNSLYLDYALGYMSFKNNYVIIDNFEVNGETIGGVTEIGYDWEFTKGIALGAKISLISGYLSEYDLFDGQNTRTIELEEDNYIGLYRADFSIGLRFLK